MQPAVQFLYGCIASVTTPASVLDVVIEKNMKNF